MGQQTHYCNHPLLPCPLEGVFYITRELSCLCELNLKLNTPLVMQEGTACISAPGGLFPMQTCNAPDQRGKEGFAEQGEMMG